MVKMRIATKDRPKVKAECLRMLAILQLDPARMHLISGFVDTYLRLNQREKQVFQKEIDRMGIGEKEQVMKIVTSWMEEGIQQGYQDGIQEGLERLQKLVLRALQYRFDVVPKTLSTQLQKLNASQLEMAMDAAFTANSLAEFTAQLPKVTPSKTKKTTKSTDRSEKSSQSAKSYRRSKPS